MTIITTFFIGGSLQSDKERGSMEDREGATFWVEENVHHALLKFAQVRAYHGRVISQKNQHALIEEIAPEGGILLPHYIMTLDVYTEREVRLLGRKILRRLQLFHVGNLVHRKLHLENVMVEGHVS